MVLDGVDLTQRRLLVAEIGNNHEGSAERALEMVEAAAEAGADAVKVQVINPERLVQRGQRERVAQLARFRLSRSVLQGLAARAREKGLLFIATPFDEGSLEEVVDLVSAVKIASGDLDYVQLLAAAACTGKPLILSTGMGTLEEVRQAVRTLDRHLPPGKSLSDSLALLHCVSAYPTPLGEANLLAIPTLKQAFPHLTVGYSDHTLGIEAALLAACLGARIIEKHFTLDKNRTAFRDHALSAEPQELGRLAAFLHSLDAILGDGEKRPRPCEEEGRVAARRSIVAARDLAAGERLSGRDLDFVRPRMGLAPAFAETLVGRRLRVALKRHEPITPSHLEEEKAWALA